MKIAFSRMTGRAALALALCATAGFSSAHDIVLMAKSGQLTMRYGHPGDWHPVDQFKLLSLDLWRPNAETESMLTAVKESLVEQTFALKGQQCLISASYDNGLWVKLPNDDYRNARKTEVPQAIESLGSFKYAKTWLPPAQAAGCPSKIGHRLEIIPLSDPWAKDTKDILVELLWEGKPLSGAGLEIGDGQTVRKEEDITRYTTDAQGRVRLPIAKRGWQVIGVDHKAPSRTPALADHDLVIATLTFWLP